MLKPSRPELPRPAGISSLIVIVSIIAGVSVLAERVHGDTQELPPAAAFDIDYSRHVAPILTEHCFGCHGDRKRESGLRLDGERDALLGGDSGRVIEPGDSAASRLITLVAGLDEERLMPPRGERLSDEQVGILRAWIDQGPKWPARQPTEGSTEPGDAAKRPPESIHWSYRPVERPVAPTVRDHAWIRSPLDAFVLRGLEDREISPSPEAPRHVLLRRLSLDLTGLPPTPEEIEAFVNDDRLDAYERIVDRLLNSVHFGEQWGRRWLDLARYADSDGYEKDRVRPHAWRYRDWVIDAMNRDVPYDRFSTEQLAGDLLPDADVETQVAMGFHRNTLHNTEGGVDREEDRVKKTVDRANTTGAIWLGLTVGCAQCHSHKYDRLTQREYYQFYAFFNNLREVDVDAPRPLDRDRYESALARHEATLRPLENALRARRSELESGLAAWELKARASSPQWTALALASGTAESGANIESQTDASLVVTGERPDRDAYRLEFDVESRVERIGALRLEVLPDDDLPKRGPGRADNGNFVVTELRLRAVSSSDDAARPPVSITSVTATHSQKGFDAGGAADGNPTTGWAIAGPNPLNRPQTAIFELAEPLVLEPTDRLVVEIYQAHGKKHTLGRFRLTATAAHGPSVRTDQELRALLSTPTDARSEEQSRRLAELYFASDDSYRTTRDRLEEARKRAPEKPDTKAQSLAEESKVRTTRVLLRGDFLRPGDEVSADTWDVLPPLRSEDDPNRLDLARWLMNANHPLTGRVAANRLWKHLFGRGIVATEDDFGVRGETPSHPELLDWLASEAVRSSWSRKALVRTIVLSSTYRQSSNVRPELAEVDPDNRLLARQNRFRVSAETVRDIGLAASGLLTRRIGGPSVRPPLPEGVAALGYADSVRWPESQGADRYRRGLYVFLQRTVLYPMLTTFDAPDRNTSCVRRERSNTPLQALTLLNDTVFVECARELARELLRAEPSDASARARLAMLRVVGREPDAPEIERVLELAREVRTELKKRPEDAARLAQAPPGQADGPDALELATWTAIGRAVLNLDEAVSRE